MGVDRTDYLMWAAKVDPDEVSRRIDEFEAETDGAPDRLFDLIHDGMCGEYAVAGRVIARSDPHDGIDFKEISQEDIKWDAELVSRVRSAFPEAHEFTLFLFSHYH